MLKNIKHITFLTLTFALVFISITTNAQEVRVIDNKGTIQIVNNNSVTTSTTAPVSPVENDVWFDTSDTNHTSTKIWDGAAWVEFSPIKAARIFYPPSIAIDASTISANLTAPGDETKDLYLEYFTQFNTPTVASTGAPAAIPTYARTDLYYYVTYFDPTIFSNVAVDANGNMTYDIIATPSNDNTLINVVFVVK